MKENSKKELLNKTDMKNLKFTKKVTPNIKNQKSFVNRFLGSIRQKMYGKNKFSVQLPRVTIELQYL